MEIIYSLKEIKNIAKYILSTTNKKIFFLNGIIGVGKTTLVKELVLQLGSTDIVSSPTYNIINKYKTNNHNIFHIDLYRIKSLQEILNIGIEEYLFLNNYCFIEWSNFLDKWLKLPKVDIKIFHKKEYRKIVISN